MRCGTGALVLACVLAVIALAAGGGALAAWRLTPDTRAWTEASATVLPGGTVRRRKRHVWDVALPVAYEVPGHGTVRAVMTVTADSLAIGEALVAQQTGAAQVVYYDPEEPGRMALSRDADFSTALAIGATAGVLAGAALVLPVLVLLAC